MANTAKVRAGLGYLKPVAGIIGMINPVAGAVVSTGLAVADQQLAKSQERQQTFNNSVDSSANDFTRHTITLTAAGTPETVNHQLDRVPNGYSVESVSSGISVFQTGQDNRTLTIDSDGPGAAYPATVKIRIY